MRGFCFGLDKDFNAYGVRPDAGGWPRQQDGHSFHI